MEQVKVNGMTPEELMKKLQEPFPMEDIEWRVQRGIINGNGEKRVIVVPYVQNRAVQNRFDTIVGIENWKNEYERWGQNGVLCGISIKFGDEWVTKFDGAEDTDFESIKGGISGASKRAAVCWGVGRYLYDLSEVWVDLKERGKNYANVKVKKGNQEQWIKGYWDEPKLPIWALPNKSQPSQQSHGQTQRQQTVGKDAESEARNLVLKDLAKTENFLGLRANPSYILPLFRKVNGNKVGPEFKTPNDIAAHATLEQLNSYHRVIKPVSSVVAFAKNGKVPEEQLLELASIVLKEGVTTVYGLFFKLNDTNTSELVELLKQEIHNRKQQSA